MAFWTRCSAWAGRAADLFPSFDPIMRGGAATTGPAFDPLSRGGLGQVGGFFDPLPSRGQGIELASRYTPPAAGAPAAGGAFDALPTRGREIAWATPPNPTAAATNPGAPAAVGGPAQVPPQYQAAFDDAVRQAGVDPALFAGLIEAESNWNPQARNPESGAAGLAQFMPDTARGLGLTDPHDPTAALAAGARYLRQNLDLFGGDVDRALAAYNAGPGRVQQYGGIPPFAETQAYVPKVKALAERYRQATAQSANPAAAAESVVPVPGALAPVARGQPLNQPLLLLGGQPGMLLTAHREAMPGHPVPHHRGLDLRAADGTNQSTYGMTVQSPIAGTVIYSAYEDYGGHGIIVEMPDGRYGHVYHLQPGAVPRGTQLRVGDPVGKIGWATPQVDSHVHFEIASSPTTNRRDFDPWPYLR